MFCFTVFVLQNTYAQTFEINAPRNTFLCSSDSGKVSLNFWIESPSLPTFPVITSSDTTVLAPSGIKLKLLGSTNSFTYQLDLTSISDGFTTISIASKIASSPNMPLYQERFSVRFGAGAFPSGTQLDFEKELKPASFGLSRAETFGDLSDLASSADDHLSKFEKKPILGPIPRFVDIDGDGDLDVFSGGVNYDLTATRKQGTGVIYFMENREGVFQDRIKTDSNSVALNLGIKIPDSGDRSKYYFPSLSFGDLDKDGDLDLFVGFNRTGADALSDGEKGGVLYYENTTAALDRNSLSKIRFTYRGKNPFGLANQFPASFLGQEFNQISPSLVDLDHDGDLDLFMSTGTGTFHYFKNISTTAVPVFSTRQDGDNPVNRSVNGGIFGLPVRAGGLSSSTSSGRAHVEWDVSSYFEDVDNDGDKDLVFGDFSNGLAYFENIADACSEPKFSVEGGASRFRMLYLYDDEKVKEFQTITVADLDADGYKEIYTGRRGDEGEDYGLFSARESFYVLDSVATSNYTFCTETSDSVRIVLPFSLEVPSYIDKSNLLIQFYSSDPSLVQANEIAWNSTKDSVYFKVPANRYGKLQLTVRVSPPVTSVATHQALKKTFLIHLIKCNPTIVLNAKSDSICYKETAFVDFTAKADTTASFVLYNYEGDTLFQTLGDSLSHRLEIASKEFDFGDNWFNILAYDRVYDRKDSLAFSIHLRDTLELTHALNFEDSICAFDEASFLAVNTNFQTSLYSHNRKVFLGTESRQGDLHQYRIDSSSLDIGLNLFDLLIFDATAVCPDTLRRSFTINRYNPFTGQETFHFPLFCEYNDGEIEVRNSQQNKLYYLLDDSGEYLDSIRNTNFSSLYFNISQVLLQTKAIQYFQVKVKDLATSCERTFPDKLIPRIDAIQSDLKIDSLEICNGQDAIFTIQNTQSGIFYFISGFRGLVVGTGADRSFGIASKDLALGRNEFDLYGISNNSCLAQMSNKPFVKVNSYPKDDLLVSYPDTLFCNMASLIFSIENSEAGVTYELVNEGGVSLGIPKLSSGGTLDYAVTSSEFYDGENNLKFKTLSPNSCDSSLLQKIKVFKKKKELLSLIENLNYQDTVCSDFVSTKLSFIAKSNLVFKLHSTSAKAFVSDKKKEGDSHEFVIDSSFVSLGRNQFQLSFYDASSRCSDTLKQVFFIERHDPFLKSELFDIPVSCDGLDASFKIKKVQKKLNYYLLDSKGLKIDSAFSQNTNDLNFVIPRTVVERSSMFKIKVVEKRHACAYELPDDIVVQTETLNSDLSIDSLTLCQGVDAMFKLENTDLQNQYFIENLSGSKTVTDFNGTGTDVLFRIEEKDLKIGTNEFKIRILSSNNCQAYNLKNAKLRVDSLINYEADVLYPEVLYCEKDAFELIIENSERHLQYQITNKKNELLYQKKGLESGEISLATDLWEFGENKLRLSIESDYKCFVNQAKVLTVMRQKDREKPTFTSFPKDTVYYTFSADTLITWATPVVNDNCSVSRLGSNYAPPVVFDKGEDYVIVYRAWDFLGNSVMDSFKISIKQKVLIMEPESEAKNDEVQIERGKSKRVYVLENDVLHYPMIDYSVNLQRHTVFGNLEYDANDFSVLLDTDGVSRNYFKVKYDLCEADGACSAAYINVTVLDDESLIIPNTFSPNGDYVNDAFVIEGISAYPENSIKIINRWGVEVFKESPYKNDWRGESSSNFGSDNSLAEGTYFYVFDKGGEQGQITGYIYLVK